MTPIFSNIFSLLDENFFVNTKCVCQLCQQYEQSASGCLDEQVTIDHLLLCHRWLLTSKMHIPLKTKFNGTFYLSKHHLKSIFPANLYGHHFHQAAKSEKILRINSLLYNFISLKLQIFLSRTTPKLHLTNNLQSDYKQ